MSSVNEFVTNYLKPNLFLTFENDQYNSSGATTQPTNPFIIPDDSGNGNHAKCYNEPVAGMDGYILGKRALYELANDTNKSILFGRYYPLNKSIHSYISVENTDDLMQNRNEVSVAFFLKLSSPHNPDRITKEYNIIRKDGLFGISYRSEYYSSDERLHFDTYYRDELNNLKSIRTSVKYENPNTLDYLGIFVVFRMKYEDNVVSVDISFNGKVVATNSTRVMDGGLDNHNTSTMFIGGMPRNHITNWLDVPMGELQFEHIMFFQRYLSNAEINNIVKRSQNYNTIIKELKPILEVDCQDNDSLNKSTVVVKYSNYVAYSLIGIEKLSDRLTPVNDAYTSFRFDGYTNIEFKPKDTNTYYNSTIINSENKSFTLWVKILNTNISTLIHGTSTYQNYTEEFRLHANSNNFNHRIGSICFSDENGQVINSTGQNLSDGEWHHIAITMSKNTVKMFIDGSLQGSYQRLNKKTHAISNISLFADVNNKNNTTGNLSFFNMYNSAIPDTTINLLYSYSFFFTINGITRLSGIPIGAELRLYNMWTGDLIDKLESDNTTGKYRFITDDGGHKQLVAIKTENNTVIPKIEAPIIPRINTIQR